MSAWFECSGAGPALIGVEPFGVIVSSPRAWFSVGAPEVCTTFRPGGLSSIAHPSPPASNPTVKS